LLESSGEEIVLFESLNSSTEVELSSFPRLLRLFRLRHTKKTAQAMSTMPPKAPLKMPAILAVCAIFAFSAVDAGCDIGVL
jgi:hypothetical protein